MTVTLQTDEVTDDRYRYREEDALKGMVRSVALRAEDGFLFSEEKNDWRVRNLAVSPDSIEVRFAYNEKTEKLIYEGTDTPETVLTTFAYDDFGNVTENKKYGALSISGDESFAFTEYINDTDLLDPWSCPDGSTSPMERERNFQKPSATMTAQTIPALPSGQVTRGNLTRQRGLGRGGHSI